MVLPLKSIGQNLLIFLCQIFSVSLIFIQTPCWPDMTQGHFIVGFHARIETHAGPSQKILDLVGFPIFETPQASSDKIRPSKQELPVRDGWGEGTLGSTGQCNDEHQVDSKQKRENLLYEFDSSQSSSYFYRINYLLFLWGVSIDFPVHAYSSTFLGFKEFMTIKIPSVRCYSAFHYSSYIYI